MEEQADLKSKKSFEMDPEPISIDGSTGKFPTGLKNEKSFEIDVNTLEILSIDDSIGECSLGYFGK